MKLWKLGIEDREKAETKERYTPLLLYDDKLQNRRRKLNSLSCIIPRMDSLQVILDHMYALCSFYFQIHSVSELSSQWRCLIIQGFYNCFIFIYSFSLILPVSFGL